MLFASFYFRFVDLMFILMRKKKPEFKMPHIKVTESLLIKKNIADSTFSFLHIYIFKVIFYE